MPLCPSRTGLMLFLQQCTSLTASRQQSSLWILHTTSYLEPNLTTPNSESTAASVFLGSVPTTITNLKIDLHLVPFLDTHQHKALTCVFRKTLVEFTFHAMSGSMRMFFPSPNQKNPNNQSHPHHQYPPTNPQLP